MKRNQPEIGKTGRKSEEKTSKRLDGKLNPSSGALDGAKGDFIMDAVLIEAKSTVNDSISLKREWLSKISGEALGQKLTPAVTITFTNGDGSPKDRGKWVLIPEYVFKELMND